MMLVLKSLMLKETNLKQDGWPWFEGKSNIDCLDSMISKCNLSEIRSMEDLSIGFIKTMFVQIVLEYLVTA